MGVEKGPTSAGMREVLVYWWNRYHRYLVGFVVGLIIGLLLAWQVFPIRLTDTYPVDLRPDYRAQYILMAATSFQQSGDAALLSKRLDSFSDSQLPSYFGEAEAWVGHNIKNPSEQAFDQKTLRDTLSFVKGEEAEPLVPMNEPKTLAKRLNALWVILGVIALGLFLGLAALVAHLLEQRSPIFRKLLVVKNTPEPVVGSGEIADDDLQQSPMPGEGPASEAQEEKKPPSAEEEFVQAPAPVPPFAPETEAGAEPLSAREVVRSSASIPPELLVPGTPGIQEEASEQGITHPGNIPVAGPAAEKPATVSSLESPAVEPNEKVREVSVSPEEPPTAGGESSDRSLYQRISLREVALNFVAKDRDVDTITIRDNGGNYLGEISLSGVEYTEGLASDKESLARALSVELFDKEDSNTNILYLVAPAAKDDIPSPESYYRIEELSRHDIFSLESASLQAEVVVRDVHYVQQEGLAANYAIGSCMVNVSLYQKQRLAK